MNPPGATEPASIAVDPPPDWASLDRTILCPLCEYNLRGLSEPRCPECGYRFVWRKLLDEEQTRHRYLFEHHPSHNIRSFLRTLFSAAKPRRFWTELQPLHTPRRLRLIIYWLIIAAAAIVAAAPSLTGSILDARRQRSQWIQRQLNVFNGNPQYAQTIAQRYGSIQAYLNLAYPSLSVRAMIWNSLVRGNRWVITATFVAAMIVVWPWASFVTLLVYRSTMDQARILPIHVLRCTIYSTEVLLLPVALFLGWIVYLRYSTTVFEQFGMDGLFVIPCLTMQVIMTYKLMIAYRKYLNFPHAAGAVIASQIIVFLVLLNAAFWGQRF